ncbi:MAG: carboxy terminal-processing peptidase [Bacteroidales bacterium]|nr:carboxy terminal-processing peptidase [Bacteroidales bacterium]MBN2756286.1 carboxy terminal-processing peptidase [Bacteroidales bacterium]
MKAKYIKFLLPAFVVFLFAFTVFQAGRKEKVLMEVLSKSLSAGHFEAYKINDELSEKLYNKYIDRLDYGKRYLLKEDIDKLKKYKFKIDDEINEGSFDFFNLSVEIIEKRIKEAEEIYPAVLEKPFNFEINEVYETDPEKLDYPKNEKERLERWTKSLKYQVLLRIDDLLTIQENAINDKDTSYKVLAFAEIEENARKKILDDYNELFRRINKQDENDRLSAYLNSLTASYDPHTEYMPPEDKKNFDIRMSGKLEGIGAQLQEINGYIKVANIVPGSASWRQGKLKAGDIILKVAEGEADPISIVDMKIDDAVSYIRGKKGTEVRLTIKKPDGTITVIPIIRDIVVLEETFAKSAILQAENSDKKYGYIYLPKFYVDFDDMNGRHCSKDVEIEVEKLKSENVDGIIIDLRNNGGGSLSDVVDMAGLFVKDGPIVQVKSRYGFPYVLKDNGPEIQYDGKLIVMVNTLSASASEILAAALQDYKRALIVGAPTTYGKGTVQRIINLDQMLESGFDDVKPLGALKLTTQKFYRINGGATQLKGVVPDIILPDIYDYIEIGERELDGVIPWDEIEPAKFHTWQNSIENKSSLVDNSKSRVQKSSTFNLIVENSKILKEQRDISISDLNLKKYREEQKLKNKKAEKFENLFKDNTSLKVSSLKIDLDKIIGDTLKLADSKNWVKDLNKDVYIEEVVNILKEMK